MRPICTRPHNYCTIFARSGLAGLRGQPGAVVSHPIVREPPFRFRLEWAVR
jgi:hypothetical protein